MAPVACRVAAVAVTSSSLAPSILAISFCVITHLCGLETVKAEQVTSAELLIQTALSRQGHNLDPQICPADGVRAAISLVRGEFQSSAKAKALQAAPESAEHQAADLQSSKKLT